MCYGSDQQAEPRIVAPIPQIDPGVEADETRDRIAARQQDRHDRKIRFPRLAIEGEVQFALLPLAETARADEDNDRAAIRQRSLEDLRP